MGDDFTQHQVIVTSVRGGYILQIDTVAYVVTTLDEAVEHLLRTMKEEDD